MNGRGGTRGAGHDAERQVPGHVPDVARARRVGDPASPNELGTGRSVIMPLSGAMRVWVAGELLVTADAMVGPALGLAERSFAPDALGERVVILAGAMALFFIPAELALRFPAARRRWWFWVGASVPAVLWVPAMPFVFLAAGPPLDRVSGLALLAGGLVGAVMVIVGGVSAALETRRNALRA